MYTSEILYTTNCKSYILYICQKSKKLIDYLQVVKKLNGCKHIKIFNFVETVSEHITHHVQNLG